MDTGGMRSTLAAVPSLLSRSLPLIGTLYLAYLAIQPPPVRYVGIACLAVVTPFLAGWVLGNVFGIGPWAADDTGSADDSL